ncbi:16239_t:CDS:2 [Funneliformis geosporum]|uniref:16239_t:CDS:1 n=1 Tax=Funneliformis geosporum TaxID=1117311 RepID=A0A9W4SR41_9GLOM|nr:16239_t:CDS:2 [Funneliformis geosporum]
MSIRVHMRITRVNSGATSNLRKYLQQNHNQLTWKQRIKIIENITTAVLRLHQENSIHRDLHSGNILYSEYNGLWRIIDFGFCGPADKPLGSIYGNLASDIYSIGMLMWEISSGQPPFADFKHNYDLVMKIMNGVRPEIIPGTPLEYAYLMVQCWDADPLKRHDIVTLFDQILEIQKSYYKNENKEQNINFDNTQSNPKPNINLIDFTKRPTS